MVVNGFELPAAFVRLCEATQHGEAPRTWGLKEDVDAYGQPWTLFDLILRPGPEMMQWETGLMLDAYRNRGKFPHSPGCANLPGFIADFAGVANFVVFAGSFGGDTLVFDFGTDPKEPSIVHWDQDRRRVAPNFETFMALFVDFYDSLAQKRRDEEDEEDEEMAEPGLRDTFTELVSRYLIIPPYERASSLLQLEDFYALIDAEERRGLEREIREEIERQGMTAEQRQLLDEVWTHLGAAHQE